MTKELRRVQTNSAASHAQVLRGVKMVQPLCSVIFTDKDGNDHPTTGPCQRAVRFTPRLAGEWFKTCTHGDESLPEKDRPYYEVSYEIRVTAKYEPDTNGDLVATGEVEKKKIKHLTPHITQVPVSRAAMSGEGMLYAAQRGFRPLADFGIAPMCEYWNCWSQDVKKFTNGTFCSEIHAKLIKAQETGKFLRVANDFEDGGESAERRREDLAEISV